MRTRISLTALICCAGLLASTRAAEAPAPDSSATPGPSPAVTAMSDIAARLELAKILTYDKKYSEAIDAYRQVLSTDPENLEAKIGLSEVLYWSGNIGAAAATLEGVPEEKLDDKAKLMLADLLVAKKAYERALGIFSAYLKQKPDDLAVRLKLADIQTWMKRYPDAIANYQLVLKANPNDRQVRRKYGMVLSWAGQNEKAVEELRKSLNE
jgi:thioredoxin-like negative regulator of GroEL